MLVITAASGASMTLVESSAPPMPTSKTTMSQPSSKKHTMAMAVDSSNWLGWSSISSAAARTRSVTAANRWPDTGRPLIWNRSRKLWRWGEIYSPVRYPAARRMDSSMAQVLPLPLLPATWTNFSPFWGSPSLESSVRVRSSPSRVALHV